ncbi:hypothetical protein N9R09_00980 [Porticoccaceae bacterium]|nr:hypothetical protein [Porticoccaceae bacterium]
MVLSSMTMVYRGALLSSNKAERTLSIIAAAPAIRIIITDRVRENLSNKSPSGEGSYGGVDYSWKATLSYEGKPDAAILLDAGSDQRYLLWDIEFSVTQGYFNRNYKFRELSW